MCFIGFLAELLCSAVAEVKEIEEVSSILNEIQQPSSEVKILKEITKDNEDGETFESNLDCKSIIAKEVLSAAIQTNPTVNVIINSIGAVQDYENGEKISDILKERTTQMVEDQIPKVVLDYAESVKTNSSDQTKI